MVDKRYFSMATLSTFFEDVPNVDKLEDKPCLRTTWKNTFDVDLP